MSHVLKNIGHYQLFYFFIIYKVHHIYYFLLYPTQVNVPLRYKIFPLESNYWQFYKEAMIKTARHNREYLLSYPSLQKQPTPPLPNHNSDPHIKFQY